MKDKGQWVKVSVVSGALIAGFLSLSDRTDDADVKAFKALVGRYSIERRQWVEIGEWLCLLTIEDDKPVTRTFFHPSNESSFYLDARHMSVCWQGDHLLFAGQCEEWIHKTLLERGLTSHYLVSGSRVGAQDPTEQDREVVSQAFQEWCKEWFQSDIQTYDSESM